MRATRKPVGSVEGYEGAEDGLPPDANSFGTEQLFPAPESSQWRGGGVFRLRQDLHVEQPRFFVECGQDAVGGQRRGQCLQSSGHRGHAAAQIDGLLVVERLVGAHRAVEQHRRQAERQQGPEQQDGLRVDGSHSALQLMQSRGQRRKRPISRKACAQPDCGTQRLRGGRTDLSRFE